MDKKPELKSFVRYGGAISFENVEIEYQTGMRATLTIYHDGEEHEKVDIEGIETEAEMIQMMIDKEFRWKSPEQVATIRRIGAEAKEKEESERDDRMAEAMRKVEEFRRKRDAKKKARENGGEL